MYEFGRFHGLLMWWRWSELAGAIRGVLGAIVFLATVASLGVLTLGFVALGVLLFGDPLLPTLQQISAACGLLLGGFAASVVGFYTLLKLTRI
jgi:type III secretory pathway component EscU